jgi:hypothetical protein
MSILVVDPVYNPNLVATITSATKLGPGITIAKFLGAYGDRTSFNHIGTKKEREAIARQLYLQAEMMRMINGNIDLFNKVRLIVSEGIYRAGPDETLSGDTLLKSKGELVYYQVIGNDGIVDLETTFDIAEYWKDYADYGEIRLDYDSYNPDNTLTAQIGVQMPTVGEDFNVNFTRMIKTFFNGQLQSDGEFIEVLEYFDRNDRRVQRNLSSKITYDTSGQSSHGRTLQNQPRNLEKQLEAEETIDNLADTRPVGSGHELTKVPENLDVVKTAVENEPEDRKEILEGTGTRKLIDADTGLEVDPNSKKGQLLIEAARKQQKQIKEDERRRFKERQEAEQRRIANLTPEERKEEERIASFYESISSNDFGYTDSDF